MLPTDRMAFRRGDTRTAPMHQQVRERFMALDAWWVSFAEGHGLDDHSATRVQEFLDDALFLANRAVALTNPVDPEPERPTRTHDGVEQVTVADEEGEVAIDVVLPSQLPYGVATREALDELAAESSRLGLRD